ncbi:hypothetical protein [Nonomuraea typhae]|uniref:hypothetical protein n=1 Tax=Nonomuraea typhae TaxID=2603600 RepID=UPI0012F79660|nr:hypothetical protein [Nonomuraea typhae]
MALEHRTRRRYAKPLACNDGPSKPRQAVAVIDGFTVTREERGLRAVHDRSGYDEFVLGDDLPELRRRATELGRS